MLKNNAMFSFLIIVNMKISDTADKTLLNLLYDDNQVIFNNIFVLLKVIEAFLKPEFFKEVVYRRTCMWCIQTTFPPGSKTLPIG